MTEVVFQKGDDAEMKVRAAEQHLRDGRPVKLRYKFRGREMVNTAAGLGVIRGAIAALARRPNYARFPSRSRVSSSNPAIRLSWNMSWPHRLS